ncbi:hypothetical protein EIP86_000109 [Pleurotus ostreatoroseus]|nr:hypothetical protein EIP86_000109 [Pleurotus ostreatoroseus]
MTFRDYGLYKSEATGSIQIDTNDFVEHSIEGGTKGKLFSTRSPEIYAAFTTLMDQIRLTEAAYGVLTDEITSLLIKQEPNNSLAEDYDPILICALPFSVLQTSKFSIGISILGSIFDDAEQRRWIRKCPSSRDVIISQETAATRRPNSALLTGDQQWLSSFGNHAEIQSSAERRNSLISWHATVRTTVERDGPIESGTKVKFEPLVLTSHGSAEHSLRPLRSSYPVQPFPLDTEKSVRADRQRRPKNQAFAGIHQSSGWLVVNRVLDVGDYFSQTFLGQLSDVSQEQLCVKIFDERWFDVASMNLEGAPIFSEDLLWREESIYDRLADFQGYLIPHFYGTFLFTTSDGWISYGIITEYINGQSLWDFYTAESLPTKELQAPIMSQIRHGVRLLRAHGIEQIDWQSDYILIIRRRDGAREVVFTEFAFAIMLYEEFWPGRDSAVPVTGDLASSRHILYSLRADEDLLDEYWKESFELEFEL